VQFGSEKKRFPAPSAATPGGPNQTVSGVVSVSANSKFSKRRSGTSKAGRRRKALQALKKETERELRDQIRRLLAKPPGERTHFLRRRTGIIGSSL
jgi:hypothetical protein